MVGKPSSTTSRGMRKTSRLKKIWEKQIGSGVLDSPRHQMDRADGGAGRRRGGDHLRDLRQCGEWLVVRSDTASARWTSVA